MAEKNHGVRLSASFYVWCEQLWRIASVYAAILILILGSTRLTPVIYTTSIKFMRDYHDIAWPLFAAFYVWISLLAVRESLTDHYSTFTLAAESKSTGRTLFKFDKRLSWQIVVMVWWAGLWRILLLPAAAYCGIALAAMNAHQGIGNYMEVLFSNRSTLAFMIFATFLLSLWAVHESLSDQYKRFRFSARPKGFYADGSPH